MKEIKQWNNHEVACLLAEMFGDNCACNFNDISEWLPQYCDFPDSCCPHTDGVACWEQFLKYRELHDLKTEALNALDRIFDNCEEIDKCLPTNERTGYKMLPDVEKIRKYINRSSIDEEDYLLGEEE